MGIFSNIAEGAAGAGLGLILGEYNDQRQLEQQKKLQDQQIEGQKEMSDYQQGQQFDMWNKTNYGAQKAHMEAAGLNPALMYGMGGSGGATTGSASGSGVGGANASQGGGGEIGMGIQMAMMEAQKRVLETQADKNAAEAEATKGVRTENVAADTANKGLQGAGLKIENQLKQVALSVANRTVEAQVMAVEEAANKLMHEANLAGTKQVINEETWKEQVSKIKQEAIGAFLSNTQTKEGIKLTQAQTNRIAVELEQKWKDLELTGRGQDMTESNVQKQVNATMISAGISAVGNLSGTTIRAITDMLKSKRGTTTHTSSNREGGWLESTVTTRGN